MLSEIDKMRENKAMNTKSPSLTNLLNNQTRRPGYAKRYAI